MTYLAMFGVGIFIFYIRKYHLTDLTAPPIHIPAHIPMSAPLCQNPRRQCRNIVEPPIYVSIRDNIFDIIIDNLGSPLANTLRMKLRRLLRLQGDFSRHLRIIRLIHRLQHILRHHPRSRNFNYQLRYPIPCFDRQVQTQGPGYATGGYGPRRE